MTYRKQNVEALLISDQQFISSKRCPVWHVPDRITVRLQWTRRVKPGNGTLQLIAYISEITSILLNFEFVTSCPCQLFNALISCYFPTHLSHFPSLSLSLSVSLPLFPLSLPHSVTLSLSLTLSISLYLCLPSSPYLILLRHASHLSFVHPQHFYNVPS